MVEKTIGHYIQILRMKWGYPMNKDYLIPKHISDFETVERIKNTNIESIKLVLPQLFEWVEDINWPIAPELASILVKFDDLIIPFLIDLIRKPDGLREITAYCYMLPELNNKQLLLLSEELNRVMNKPTAFEKEEGYDKLALKYLRKISE
jgi:hypothetical protein